MGKTDFKKRYEDFDEFVEQLVIKKKTDENIFKALNSIRGLVCGIIPKITTPNNKIISWAAKFLTQFKNSTYKIPCLSIESETVILSSDPRCDESTHLHA